MILVVGVGRSGTSLVAGMLHKLGVLMGKEFHKEADVNNQWGYWEDKDFLNLSIKYQNHSLNESEFVDGLQLLRSERTEPWGFKDPRIADLLPFYLSIFNDAQFVWCKRKKEDVIASLAKTFNDDMVWAKSIYDSRNNMLEKLLPAHAPLEVHYEDRENLMNKLCSHFSLVPTEDAKNFVMK